MSMYNFATTTLFCYYSNTKFQLHSHTGNVWTYSPNTSKETVKEFNITKERVTLNTEKNSL